MLWMAHFQCTNKDCEATFDMLVEKKDKKKPVECPHCFNPAKPIIGNPLHTKHVSWSSWRIGHGSK